MSRTTPFKSVLFGDPIRLTDFSKPTEPNRQREERKAEETSTSASTRDEFVREENPAFEFKRKFESLI